MNNLVYPENEKPTKPLNLVGFVAFCISSCRKEGIRTLDTVTRVLPFQGSLFNHSSTFLFGFANVKKRFHISGHFAS